PSVIEPDISLDHPPLGVCRLHAQRLLEDGGEERGSFSYASDIEGVISLLLLFTDPTTTTTTTGGYLLLLRHRRSGSSSRMNIPRDFCAYSVPEGRARVNIIQHPRYDGDGIGEQAEADVQVEVLDVGRGDVVFALDVVAAAHEGGCFQVASLVVVFAEGGEDGLAASMG
ncbi:MAG: hypothetical protein Q9216_005880, partial [Gyalolechia sp. 2 TL-2023]